VALAWVHSSRWPSTVHGTEWHEIITSGIEVRENLGIFQATTPLHTLTDTLRTTTKTFIRNGWYLGRDSNWASSKHSTQKVPTTLSHSTQISERLVTSTVHVFEPIAFLRAATQFSETDANIYSQNRAKRQAVFYLKNELLKKTSHLYREIHSLAFCWQILLSLKSEIKHDLAQFNVLKALRTATVVVVVVVALSVLISALDGYDWSASCPRPP
jgi:hypothetical protein